MGKISKNRCIIRKRKRLLRKVLNKLVIILYYLHSCGIWMSPFEDAICGMNGQGFSSFYLYIHLSYISVIKCQPTAS